MAPTFLFILRGFRFGAIHKIECGVVARCYTLEHLIALDGSVRLEVRASWGHDGELIDSKPTGDVNVAYAIQEEHGVLRIERFERY